MKQTSKIAFIIFILLGLTQYSYAQERGWFTDVPKTHPSYEAVKYVWEQGYIDGYADGTFRLDGRVNRAEMTKIAVSHAKIPVQDAKDTKTNSGFFDIPTGSWYARYVVAAKKHGIIEGYSNNTFRASQPVNLVESLKILLVAHQIKLDNLTIASNPYSDTPKDQFFALYVQYAKENNLLIPDQENRIFPDKPMTRAKLAELIYRLDYVIMNSRPFPPLIIETRSDTVQIKPILEQNAIKKILDIKDKRFVKIIAMTSDIKGNSYILTHVPEASGATEQFAILKMNKLQNVSFLVSSTQFDQLGIGNPTFDMLTADKFGDVYTADQESGTVVKITHVGEISIFLNGNKLVNTIGRPNKIGGGKTVAISDIAVRDDGLIYIYDTYVGFSEEYKPVLWLINPQTYAAVEVSNAEIQLLTGLKGQYYLNSLELIGENDLYLVENQSASLIRIDNLQNMRLILGDMKIFGEKIDMLTTLFGIDNHVFIGNIPTNTIFDIDTSSPAGTLQIKNFSVPKYLDINTVTSNGLGMFYITDKNGTGVYALEVK